MKRRAYTFLAVALLSGVAFFQGCSPKAPESQVEEPPARQAVRVRAVVAEVGSVQSWVFAEGTARSARREYLTFANPGRVAWVKPGEDGGELREGDFIKAGNVLARQDDRQYQADVDSAVAKVREAKTQAAVAVAQLEQAKAEYKLAQTTLRRFKKLLEQKSAAEQEYDEANANAAKALASVARAKSQIKAANAQVEAANAQERQMRVKLEETELRSPIDGVVAYLNIKPGYYFTPSLVRTDSESAALQTVPMVVIDTSVFEVIVNVPSYDRGRVKPGQEALIALNGQESLEANANAIRGVVFSVNPAVSPGGRSVQVKIRTTKGTQRLEDGVFVTVWIATEARMGVLTIPAAALIYRDNNPFVFIVNPETQTVGLRQISLGLQGLMSQEVSSGVKAGELLVTDGRFQLTNGAAVEVLESNEKGST